MTCRTACASIRRDLCGFAFFDSFFHQCSHNSAKGEEKPNESPRSTMLHSAASHTSKILSSRAFSTRPNLKNVVIVAGVRLPFSMSSSIYKDELAVDLQRLAIQGLLTETALPKNEVDYVICGNVIQEVRTSNIAREAAINVGLPINIGAHTIAQVCLFIVLVYIMNGFQYYSILFHS